MGKTTYAELLQDPRWQRKRLQIMERDNFTCQHCWDKQSTLHVHHVHYLKGKAPWEHPDHLMVTLCWDCHTKTPVAVDCFKAAVAHVHSVILHDFSMELAGIPQQGAWVRVFTAILQSPEKKNQIVDWFNALPPDKQRCIREGEP